MNNPSKLIHLISGVIFIAMLISPAFAASNPYCVSGANWEPGGTMERLEMPKDSLGYIWDELQPTNRANMVRPCRYWQLYGVPHKFHGYHEATDTIDDATKFGDWVDAHPGKIWIIGNEPDLNGQDGISPEQYARMFHTYYQFIHPRDASATFAVAGLAALVPPSWISRNTEYWEKMLDSYSAQFGQLPPIDIWNCHCYTLAHSLDAEVTMKEYITPFVNWVRSVRGGAYATAEIWLTEFGAGGGSLTPEHYMNFMKQLCPRLEHGGINRFFWFVGPWSAGWDPGTEEISLLNVDGTKRAIGECYSALARSAPNQVPTPLPKPTERPLPPLLYTDSFDDNNPEPWIVKGGDWTINNNAYGTVRAAGVWSTYVFLPYDYSDGIFEADVRIDQTAKDNKNWAGLTFRQQGATDSIQESGYLVLLRADGDLALYTGADKTVASASNVVTSATASFNRLRVEVTDFTFKVSVNGTPCLEWTDPNRRWRKGHFNLETGRTSSWFDNIHIAAKP